LNDEEFSEPFPEALAVLIFVWSITAESPAVAEPEP
jgi:hypothetical protein